MKLYKKTDSFSETNSEEQIGFLLHSEITAYINSFTSAATFLGSNLIPGPIVVER